MVIQGFKQLLLVQPPMAYQFSVQEEHRHLVAVSNAGLGIGVHIPNLDRVFPRGRHLLQFGEQRFAQTASGPRVEHETHGVAALNFVKVAGCRPGI